MHVPVIFLVPILVGLIAQVTKVAVEASRTGTINLGLVNSYGGMPSSHTAFVISLATVIALTEGFDSPVFVLAAVFAIITIRDAIGFRMYMSEHARILNKLVAELPAADKPKFPTHLIERIGHTPLQATVGALIGVGLTLLFWVALA